ncbi:glycosyltransferase [Eubacterium limosum]|uniref:Glycosyltransferase n=1 Tax=Eubacterium limosum TaxID=1736 RepID=A0ABT5UST8_EUBLI|nr:glycosyltransferase [Eubacterium limosum]MCB6569842.1 glycosyltransferase [Eubacterium limosum]MDE1471020.1 glycosyltransferase [Eubacterium limosum]
MDNFIELTGKKMQNLVSIIMPSYNTAEYISKSIESILRQTYRQWELIIVDDCSTDNTNEVVKPYLKDKRIHFLKNEKNLGAAISRNRALKEAKGRWIAFLDSDDLWLSEKLEKQIEFMLKKPCFFSYTEYEEIDERDISLKVRVSGPKKITRTGMFNYCWPGCLTVMYDANKIGLIQISNIQKNNDYAMWLKICKKTNCYLLDKCLAKYRRGRKDSISTQSYRKLILWHYKLFREAERQSVITSLFNTGKNIIFGIYKKKKYIKRLNVNY